MSFEITLDNGSKLIILDASNTLIYTKNTSKPMPLFRKVNVRYRVYERHPPDGEYPEQWIMYPAAQTDVIVSFSNLIALIGTITISIAMLNAIMFHFGEQPVYAVESTWYEPRAIEYSTK